MKAVIVFSLLSGIFASADMGPKPSIDLTVNNAPNENYYIDLLYSKDWHLTTEDIEIKREIENAASESDREMMRTVVEYEIYMALYRDQDL
ncbi:MAG: hypothetical protein IKO27_04840 [Ruminococcus sp.]|nr:hypothetical protein [Ruminococcus sp.]